MSQKALLALQDGSLFRGQSIGISGETVGEVVFNTAMTGYQEILTDPSYARQIVTLTYPHIGNVGTCSGDEEAGQVHVAGLVIRDLPLIASNWRNTMSLSDYLRQHKTVAIADIDTRRLTRILREKGAQNGCIVAGEQIDEKKAIARAQAFAGLKGMDLAKEVTTVKQYQWTQGSWSVASNQHSQHDVASLPYHVVAYDYGIKRNILNMLVDRGCRVTVVPAKMTAADVLSMKPDGVFLFNGSGDPEPCDYTITAIRDILKTDTPVFGICLGHQLLSLACGAKTFKLKFGHRGANQPVLNVETGKVEITAQNHGFAVEENSLPNCLKITHRNLNDDTIAGVRHLEVPAFSVQYHPEASSGPHDSDYLFRQFRDLLDNAACCA